MGLAHEKFAEFSLPMPNSSFHLSYSKQENGSNLHEIVGVLAERISICLEGF